MSGSHQQTQTTRRSFLKTAVAAGAALTTGVGSVAGQSSSYDTVKIDVYLSDDTPSGFYEDYVVPAVDTIQSQVDVPFETELVVSDGIYSYSGGYGDIISDFKDRRNLNSDAINLLVYDQVPTGGGTAVHADMSDDRSYPDGSKPSVAVVNGYTRIPVEADVFTNTLITGILRPILSAQEQLQPGSLVNSFGDVYGDLVLRSASPLTTWHVGTQFGCSTGNLFGSLDFEDDNVDTTCSYGAPDPICSVSTELSDCTQRAVEAQLSASLPPVGGGDPPNDLDGDGLYEDVNGNGKIDLGDTVDFFQNRDSDAIQGHVDAYDFSGNGQIDLADVTELFDMVE